MSNAAAKVEPPAAAVAVPKNGSVVLRADHVARHFVDGDKCKDVLKDINLSLRSGEVSALVGRSGSGKSTLLHLLGLLDSPDSGEILIDNTPAGTLSESDRSQLRNRYIGFVFQHYFLLPEFNVLDNVLMPAKVACSAIGWLSQSPTYLERAHALLKEVGLEAQLNQKPLTCSGGERQRIALARALLLEPKLLLCDEPTGNLDPETATHIMDLIFDFSRKHGTAVLIVTHDRAASGRADRILRLDHGVLSTEK